ncbi:MAG TPA: M48 family metallopeptidase [Pyrinomonadaceae bacterium]|nr:M48 family metallopeptidase [Pyrinomonadaceae bacterium]
MPSTSRSLTALALAVSLWASAISAVAAPLQQQTQDAPPPPPPSTQSQKDAKDKEKKAPATPAKPQQTTATSRKPLSTNEDPAMIGKRKINSGLIASMSGSLEKEVALGRAIAAEVDKQAKFIDDPVITEYVNRVGQNIVLHSDARVPFTIKVIDSDEVNAFALPGGFFYVNKGLILAADNEAELAGVMAHEIAHVAARHAVENQTKAMLAEYSMIAGSIFLGGILGAVINNAAQFGALLGFMKFSRSAEEEADKLGVQYMYASGYDPNAMATMFEKLMAKNQKKPGFISKAFSTHPMPSDRRASALALAARFPDREEYVISTSEFQRVKGRLLRLSNARVTTSGALPGSSDDGTPGRPTLKRRQPTPDDSTTTPTTDDTNQPSNSKPSDPPKLKRNDGSTPTSDSSKP